MEQRKEQILSLAYQDGHIQVRKLAEHLSVSEATIRRDLHGLASEGLLELTHGGASVVRNTDYSFLSKSVRNVEAKRVIAKMTCDLIADGDQLFLDSGTTCFEMTSFLRSKRGLSIIINSIRMAQELYPPTLNVLMLGGQYRPDRLDTVGPMAAEVLERLRGYRAFLGTDGLGMDFGPTASDVDSAHIYALAAKNARERILLADSSKFDNPSLYKITEFSQISTIITEKRPSPKWEEFLKEQKVKIIYPEQDSKSVNPKD
ncbi:MAG TPA: DeoR/GlpR family DNA-binding transcription regulator [Alphaproteobacteria bacterium]|nr:DeoR/GlpR family DNA-binding transcription regulator [Alphaproteobacteria bacterium]